MFAPAFKRTVIGCEGPYDHDPQDPGGETVWGITRKYQASWPGWKRFDEVKAGWAGRAGDKVAIVDFVTNDEVMQLCVKDFYRRGPWASIRGDELKDQGVAEELFDSGINCGMATAIKWLQRALNIFNRGGKDYPDIEVDGNFGNQTLECLNTLVAARGPWLILKALNAQQGMHYLTIAEKNPALEKFEAGWWGSRIS